MISKTIAFRGFAYFQTHPNGENLRTSWELSIVFLKNSGCASVLIGAIGLKKKTKMFWAPLGAQKLGVLETKMTRNLQFPKKAGWVAESQDLKRLHLFACGQSSWSLHLRTRFQDVLHAVAHPQGALRRWVPICFVLSRSTSWQASSAAPGLRRWVLVSCTTLRFFHLITRIWVCLKIGYIPNEIAI